MDRKSRYRGLLDRVAKVIIDAERTYYTVGKLPGMIPREVLER